MAGCQYWIYFLKTSKVLKPLPTFTSHHTNFGSLEQEKGAPNPNQKQEAPFENGMNKAILAINFLKVAKELRQQHVLFHLKFAQRQLCLHRLQL